MSKQHTPAPWTVLHGDAVQIGTSCIVARHDQSGTGFGMGAANARLIAAAPDMLEALHSAHNQICVLLGANAELQQQARLAGDQYEECRRRRLGEGSQAVLREIEAALSAAQFEG
jgi:hypothetical protein